MFFLCLLAGAVVTFNSPNLYRAETTLYFPAPSQPILSGGSAQGMTSDGLDTNLFLFGGMGHPSIQEYALAILKSRTMSDKVLDKFGEGLFPGRFHDRKRVQLRELMGRYIKIMMGVDKVITISVETVDPLLSKEIADFYTEQFKEIAKDAILTTAKNKRIHLTQQLELLKQELDAYEERLAAFEKAQRVVDLETETRAAVENYGRLLLMSASFKAEERSAQVKLDTLRDKMRKQAKMQDDEGRFTLLMDQPMIRDLVANLAHKEQELLKAQQSYTDLHPKVKELKNDIADIKSLIRRETAGYLSDIESDLVPSLIEAQTEVLGLRAQNEAMDGMIELEEEKLGRIPDLKVEYNRIKRTLENRELVLSLVEQELEKARIEEAREDAQVQVMDEAAVPDYRVKPDVMYNMILSGVLGLILGLMGCIYAEYGNRVVDNIAAGYFDE